MMRKCKTVSFDLTDTFEAGLLAHAEANGKFSKYIKRLIQQDKNGVAAKNPAPFNEPANDDDEDAAHTFF